MSFDPVTLMTIGRAVSAVSTVVGTIGSMNAASYQSAVAARNADIMERNATRAIEDAQREQQDYGEEARGQIGSLVASLSASGASLAGGSGSERIAGGRGLLRRDASRIREAGNLEAEGFQQAAQDARTESQMARQRSRFALFGGVLEGGSSFLSNTSRIQRARSALIQ